MEWFWSGFCALISAIAFGAARHFWRAPARWRNQGFVSNGLGYTIKADENPKGFDAAIAGSKAWATLTFAVGGIGVVFALGWEWKAFS